MKPGMLSLSEIEELPRNAKNHDLGAIHQSYDRFSFIERLIINNTTGHLVAGHGRLHALKQRKQSGKEAPEGIDVQGDEWLVPVDYVDIPADKEEAAAIALNRLPELGGWDEETLLDTLTEIERKTGLAGTGFDVEDLDNMVKSLGMWGVGIPESDLDPDSGGPEQEITPELFERQDYLLFVFDNEMDWQVACDILGVKIVRDAAVKGKTFDHHGIGRVIPAPVLLEKLAVNS